MATVDLDELILEIHAAALEEDGWAKIGARVRKVLGAEGALLLRLDADLSEKPWVRMIELDPAAVRHYIEHWGVDERGAAPPLKPPEDLWCRGALRSGRMQPGVVSVSADSVSEREFTGATFRNDFLRLVDLDASQADGTDGTGALSLYRGVNKPSFSSTERNLLRVLTPHLVVAAQNYNRMRALRMKANSYRRTLDCVNAAVFAINPAGRLVYANRSGERELRNGSWLSVSQGKLTAGRGVATQSAVSTTLVRALAGIACETLLTEKVSGAEALLSAHMMSKDANNIADGEVAALIWLRFPTPGASAAQPCAKLFNLSGAETRLLERLMSGEDLAEASISLHMSVHTARSHLKSIFRKTNHRTQGKLLLLAGQLAAVRSSDSAE
jgi:DNA-binding CsgD family transcriptional regulator/PAS domain-containing protein